MLGLTRLGLRRFWTHPHLRNDGKINLTEVLEKSVLSNPEKIPPQKKEPTYIAGSEFLPRPYYLHAKCLKNNTHITLCNPDKKIIYKASSGSCGFRKGKRRGYDTAYTVTSKVLEQIRLKNMSIENLYVIFCGFSQAREAVQNCLLGQEGSLVRDKIVKIMDKSPIKFGGPRGRNVRRI
ncbi:ribosomal protein subunit S18 [Schizosaccharomyces cryophilus OY26]|uniref:Ribosomal protein subunit S18 n=1 Tax=Schizosaccharomyces cryophilus (strain OY26 / ATCC MYA-4695 / CBS 11777 / NBRC 106824 / NRRL Y48691) TaxID=653667 RepID=S9VY65_SCHCR|nr:ribosomal protein subunit S18 [Schizosaccharomyces cryophilus OY26]EPY52578.1 ribosomal protein subunit S18 [Schizosaccharomyces cryophilus OY26]